MRKFATLFTMLMLFSALAFGQDRMITGTVTDETGAVVQNASVSIKGTTTGTVADANGRFTIKAKTGDVLLISGTNIENQQVTIGSGSSLDVRVTSRTKTETEVVVTAQGIRKKPRELGTAVSVVKNEVITNGKSGLFGPSLSGKVSGLTIQNTNNGVNNDVRITLRGNRSITGQNQALVVLDGVPVPQNTISFVNPNDIENVTILKGGQAATLYGSDGVNGAILITTKKGARGKMSVTTSTTISRDEVNFLPEFQTEFGSGSGYGLTPQENYRTYENQQFGDRYDGSIRPLGRVLPDGSIYYAPYAAIPNVRRDLFDKASNLTQDVAISGGDATSQYYASFQHFINKGIVPKDRLARTSGTINASKEFGKLKISSRITYAQDRANTTFSNFYDNVLNTSSHIPLNSMRNWQTDVFASPDGFYNDYAPNPWWELDAMRTDANNNYFNGNVELNFQPKKWINFTYRVGLANTNSFSKSYQDIFTYSNYAKNLSLVPAGWPDGGAGKSEARSGDSPGFVQDNQSYGNRVNSDFVIAITKDFNDFSTKLVLGNNMQVRKSKTTRLEANALALPGIFNVGNRKGELTSNSFENSSRQAKYGNYADLTLGYKDYAFVHGTYRVDASSLFYTDLREKKQYTYGYYGVDASLVLTDAFKSIKGKFLDYLKLRAAFNRNGNDNLNPYDLSLTYGVGTGFPYGSLVGTTVGNTFPANDLSPEFVNSVEVGFEAAFVKGRINLEATAYKQKSEGQIIAISTSSATGFTNARINSGVTENLGFELDLRAQVIRKPKFNWDVNANFSYNDNEVKTIFQDLTRVTLTSTTFSGNPVANIVAQIGSPYPYLRVRSYVRDPASGKIIVGADGFPTAETDLKDVGRVIPKHTLGLGTNVRVGNFNFAANVEYRGGYFTYQRLGNDMAFTGTAAITTKYGREKFIWPNSVYFDGSKYVDNNDRFVNDGAYFVWDDHTAKYGEPFAVSGAFWKIRDASLSWMAPKGVTGFFNNFFKEARITVFGRNLLTLVPKENVYADPEFSTTTGNGVGISTTGQTPPTRSYGATLQLTF
jgi:TonB-linked SusC/RagA family outer membrane protein